VTGQCSRTWQGRPCLVVRPCLACEARWFHLPPKFVPDHKNCNTTHGTLFVSKVCMKLVVYSSRTRGFDSRNFVVRTVNNGYNLIEVENILLMSFLSFVRNMELSMRGHIHTHLNPMGLPKERTVP
jgi:hypothetical protein